MARDARRLVLLTGGPGAGKSTLLSALAAAGHVCAPEAGRAIIRQQMAIDGPALPWRDPRAFAEAMLGWDMRSHEMHRDAPGTVFFDRGLPDVAGYLTLSGCPVPAHVTRACATYRYDRTVFVAPPWAEIYERDAERRQGFDEACRTCTVMVDTYRSLGYSLVELPRVDVEGRVAFVEAQLRLGT